MFLYSFRIFRCNRRIVPASRMFLLLALLVLPVLSGAARAASVIGLDNTNDGAKSLFPAGSTITDDGLRRRGIVFTTPAAGTVKLTNFRFGLQESSAGSTLNLRAYLYAVDGSNLPTGPAL